MSAISVPNLTKWDRIYVAYSGGLDSTVLLHFLSQQALPISVVHIDHQLHPDSKKWAAHCQAQCEAWNIPCLIKTIELKKQKGESLEEAARIARYAAFKEILAENTVICTAHHQDDQAETVLLQLLRGAGLAGLAAMPMQAPLGKGVLCRPFLQVPRKDLQEYAQKNGLKWIEDPSNEKVHFDRNYVRHQVMPIIQERFPSSAETLSRSARHCAEANLCLETLAEEDYAQIQEEKGISISRYLSLPAARQRYALCAWLKKYGFGLPSTAQWEQLQQQLKARADAQPLLVWNGAAIRPYRDTLYAEPYKKMPDLREICLTWDLEMPLKLPEPLGYLIADKTPGEGLSLTALSEGPISIRFRARVLPCKPVGRAHSQTLKKLFQEYGIPPWIRPHLPLLYCGEALAAVLGAWICEGFQAAPNEAAISIRNVVE